MTLADACTAAWLDRVLSAAPSLTPAQQSVVRAALAPHMKQAAPATETRAALETASPLHERAFDVTA